MMDRYENKELELDLEERIGFKFMKCCEEVYKELTRVQESKQVKIKDKLPAVKTALEDAIKKCRDYERVRGKFMVPESLLADYLLAKDRYKSNSLSPEAFRQKDEQIRVELEKSRVSLAVKIQVQEAEFARAEEDRINFINDERLHLNAELAGLVEKKEKYLATIQSGRHFLPIWSSRAKKKLPNVLERINEVEKNLKTLPEVRGKFIRDKRDDLTRLHKRRWDIEKALNAYEEAGGNTLQRWVNAIDRAEVEMIIRRMDIEKAVERYYAECPVKVMHAFYSIYSQIMNLVSQYHVATDHLSELKRHAEILYCPGIAERSVDTIYKVKKNKDEEQAQSPDHLSINKQGYRYG